MAKRYSNEELAADFLDKKGLRVCDTLPVARVFELLTEYSTMLYGCVDTTTAKLSIENMILTGKRVKK